jgi:hypothetical protein
MARFRLQVVVLLMRGAHQDKVALNVAAVSCWIDGSQMGDRPRWHIGCQSSRSAVYEQCEPACFHYIVFAVTETAEINIGKGRKFVSVANFGEFTVFEQLQMSALYKSKLC